MAVLKILVCLAAMSMFIELTMAANLTVGGTSGGWDTSTDLKSWVSSQNFAAGDNLIFQYTQNHDVLEVTKADHDSCTTSSPLQTYTGGNTIIPLTTAGKRYFICGTLGHCSQGMQIEIDTSAASTPSAPPPSSTPSAPTPSSSPSASTPSSSPSASPAPESSPSAPTTTPGSAPGSPLSPDVPSAESPSVVSPPPSASLANRNGIRTCFTMGFGLVLVALLAL